MSQTAFSISSANENQEVLKWAPISEWWNKRKNFPKKAIWAGVSSPALCCILVATLLWLVCDVSAGSTWLQNISEWAAVSEGRAIVKL